MADIQFENIEPYVEGQGGDTGLTARQKLKRNFDKIKAWMDSVAQLLSGRYLSKVDDDEAEGVITFLQGILLGAQGAWGWVKETVENRVGTGWAWFKHLLADTLEALSALINGNLTVHGGDLTVESDDLGNGGDVSIEGNLTVTGLTTLLNTIISNLTVQHNLTVNETATITNLIVTGAAHFFKVIIDEIKAAGGAIVVTPADGFTVDLVENITITLNGVSIPGKRLYWRVSDGEKARTNKWHVLDQALCKTDNLASGTTYNASNKFYWSLVANVSNQPVSKTIDGKAADCHYIDIYCGNGESQANIPKDANDIPLWYWVGDARDAAAGDEISMLGSRDATDVPRQSALYFSAYSSIDTGLTAPFIASYRGVNDFDLASHRKTYMDAVGQAFYGQFFSTASDSDNPTDIEDLLTGSELKIIYGEGSPLVTQPEQHWTQADYTKYADKCFYYDISLEPALEGGRFWKWTLIPAQANGDNPIPEHYGWVHVTDVDTTAALEKISNVASDGILTGGGEKTRVYLEWMEAVKTYTTLRSQMQENNSSGDWTNYNSQAEYKTGVTFYTAWSNFNTAFFALATYLNNKTDFSSNFEVTPPSWINDQNRGTSTVLPPWLDTDFPPGKAEWNTGPKAYRGVWQDYYDTMIEMRRALDAWQYKVIDEMGDDGLIDPVEKATLRQMFNDEVIAYWKRSDQNFDLMTKIPSTESEYSALTQTETAMQSAFQQLGSYMCGETPMERTSGQGDWYIATPLPWTLQNSMRNGLQDPPETGTAPSNLYPLWLQKGNDTQSTVVDDDIWDYFWAQFTKAKQAHIDAIAAGHQYQIDHAAADILPEVFIQASAPTEYKEGDHWYQPTTLTNPVTGASVSQDQNGNPIYNHYIARKVSNVLEWVLVNAATTSVFSQIASQIYAAVFDSANASSLVMRTNSIESTVSKIEDGSQNLLLNGHFEDGTNHYSAYNSGVISVVAQSGLPYIFQHCLKIQTSSGGTRGMQFSKSNQPYILLENGKTYTFSFWAKGDSAKRIKLYRGSDLLGSTDITTEWARYGYTIQGDGESKTFSLRDNNNSDTVTYYLVGLQLELGQRTDWQDFGGEPVIMKSQITQLANKISLAVFKDEARKAGIDIEYDETTDSGTVTLDGDKVVVDGDLDLKGLTTENVTMISRNLTYPTIINMGIVDDEDENPVKMKSVQVKAENLAGSGSYYTYAPNCPIVVLPFYDAYVGNNNYGSNNWWKGIGSGQGVKTCENWNVDDDTSKLYGGFTLYPKTGVDGSLRRVVPWKENGTKLTITNEVDIYASNWQALNTTYSDLAGKLQWLVSRAILICADARIVSAQNIELNSSYPFIGPYGKYSSADREQNPSGNDAVNDSGRFSCGGYMSRFIVLLPGQSLQLRSQIITVRGRNVLNWVVENPTEFAPLPNFPIELTYYDNNDGDGLYLKAPAASAFNPTASHEATSDVILGADILNEMKVNGSPIGLSFILYGDRS